MQVSIVHLSSIEKNIDFRYEPEFWLPKYLNAEGQLLKIETTFLAKCINFTNGSAFDSTEFGSLCEIPISKIGDVTQKRNYQL